MAHLTTKVLVEGIFILATMVWKKYLSWQQRFLDGFTDFGNYLGLYIQLITGIQVQMWGSLITAMVTQYQRMGNGDTCTC